MGRLDRAAAAGRRIRLRNATAAAWFGETTGVLYAAGVLSDAEVRSAAELLAADLPAVPRQTRRSQDIPRQALSAGVPPSVFSGQGALQEEQGLLLASLLPDHAIPRS
jgi:hypothetical protein